MSDDNMANWLAPAAAALLIVACYGTLAGFVVLCTGTYLDWRNGRGRAERRA